MYHQVKWNSKLLEEFVKQAELSEEEAKLMYLRADNQPRYVIAKELGVSEPTVSRLVAELKIKYDNAVAKYGTLPKRRMIKEYQPVYRDFKGYILVDDNIIELEKMTFNSLEEARKHIVASVESLTDNEFANLDKTHFKLDIEFDIDIKK